MEQLGPAVEFLATNILKESEDILSIQVIEKKLRAQRLINLKIPASSRTITEVKQR